MTPRRGPVAIGYSDSSTWHIRRSNGDSACGRSREEVGARERPASKIPPKFRCGAPGCASRWPAALRLVG